MCCFFAVGAVHVQPGESSITNQDRGQEEARREAAARGSFPGHPCQLKSCNEEASSMGNLSTLLVQCLVAEALVV